MYKKILSLLFASTLLLVACGEEADVGPEEDTEDNTEETTELMTEDADEATSNEQQTDNIIEVELGRRTIVKKQYGINEAKESGPIKINIIDAQLSQFQPCEDMIDFFEFEGEDLAMVGIKMKVENKSKDTNTIYPDQGILVTDTGKEVDADLFVSDDLGGDFRGEVTKEGQVYFFFDGQAKDVSEVHYLINAAQNEDSDKLGEDIEFVIKF